MRSMTATAAKDQFGKLIDDARLEPVAIEKHGRQVAVVLSKEMYEHLTELEDRVWVAKAEAAHRDGHVGQRPTTDLLREILSAES